LAQKLTCPIGPIKNQGPAQIEYYIPTPNRLCQLWSVLIKFIFDKVGELTDFTDQRSTLLYIEETSTSLTLSVNDLK
jgi:hypothetical protein